MGSLKQGALGQTKESMTLLNTIYLLCALKRRQDNKSIFTGICKTNNLVSAGRNKESPCSVGMHPCSFTIFIDLDRCPHTQTLYSGREQRNVQNMKDWLHMEITAGIKACRHGLNYSSGKGHDSNCGFISKSFSKIWCVITNFLKFEQMKL